jgi:hypothetical protein
MTLTIPSLRSARSNLRERLDIAQKIMRAVLVQT